MVIDGASQPGTPPNTPGIQVDGSIAGTASGFVVTSGQSTINGFIITDFHKYGVFITKAGNDLITNCCIGVAHYPGEHAAPNHLGGVVINNQPSNTVSYCVISGNDEFGVLVTGLGATGNLILENNIGLSKAGNWAIPNIGNGVVLTNGATTTNINSDFISGNTGNGIMMTGATTQMNTVNLSYIGTDITGLTAIPNLGNGILLAAPSNTIGGPTPPPTSQAGGNTISGNAGNGISIMGPLGKLEKIYSNYIGVASNGSIFLPNKMNGVLITNSPMDSIGDGTAANRNVISSNALNGIDITGAGSTTEQIYGNYIGTDLNGTRTSTQSLGNSVNGILVNGSPSVKIGGINAGQGNVISDNGSNGIELTGAGTTGAEIQGNTIGLDVTGEIVLGNGANGILATGLKAGGSIGGPLTNSGNVISGNNRDGILLTGGSGGFNIFGNYIGTDVNGMIAKPNRFDGISLNGSPDNLIGGMDDPINVISGNLLDGISISGNTAKGNTIQFSEIGTNLNGTLAVANGMDGIEILNAPHNFIGVAAGTGNIISGNNGNGIEIIGSTAATNLITANNIGVGNNGTSAIGNMKDGIRIAGAPGTIIGFAAAMQGNVVSGNIKNGIEAISAPGLVILNNKVGTNAAGAAAVGNSGDGILLTGCPGARVGGALAMQGNVISGNIGDGVSVMGAASALTSIMGNLIGTNAAGAAAVANGSDGISLSAATRVAIGGIAAGAGNLISGNGSNGIEISGDDADGNTIYGNFIGTQAGGAGKLGNMNDGVLLDDGPMDNQIGGVAAGAGNIIAANTVAGIEIMGDCIFNEIANNVIGLDKNGAKAGNFNGVWINGGATANIVGGTRKGTSNTIAGNLGDGVLIEGAGSDSNEVAGNYIGTNAAGAAGLGNTNDGVLIQNNASFNDIGAKTAPNVLSSNGANGVEIIGAAAAGNSVMANFIGTDITGTKILGNGNDGVLLTAAVSTNVLSNDIVNNAADGVALAAGATKNTIQVNEIGVDPTAAIKMGNTLDGIVVNASPANKLYSNIIAANAGNGIQVIGLSTFTRVFGNFIGLAAAGFGNGGAGIFLNGASNNVIGGGGKSANDIDNNAGDGILLKANANANAIMGNDISSNANGINIVLGSNNTIGVVSQNDIHNNRGFGVGVAGGTGDWISRNSIYGDAALGIDLGENGVTLNHVGAAPAGSPNNYQNFPVLNAVSDGPSTRVSVSLESLPDQIYTVELFSNLTAGSQGYGEGDTYLRSVSLKTNSAGLAKAWLHVPGLGIGDILTATATDATHDTSEFSKAVTVVTAPPEVTDSQLVLDGGKVTKVVLSFSEGLIGTIAQNIKNYALDLPNGSGVYNVAVPLASAVYSPSSETVTLKPVTPFSAGEFVQIFASDHLVSLSGTQLDGQFSTQFPSGTGAAGSNFSILEEDAASISYTDSVGNHVSLSLASGGIMDLIRNVDGQGELLTLLDTTASSTLSGSVTQGGTGNGTTTLTAIYGLAFVTDDLPASFKITG